MTSQKLWKTEIICYTPFDPDGMGMDEVLDHPLALISHYDDFLDEDPHEAVVEWFRLNPHGRSFKPYPKGDPENAS